MERATASGELRSQLPKACLAADRGRKIELVSLLTRGGDAWLELGIETTESRSQLGKHDEPNDSHLSLQGEARQVTTPW